MGKVKSIPRRTITAHTFGRGQFKTTCADAQKGQNRVQYVATTNFDKRHPQRPLFSGLVGVNARPELAKLADRNVPGPQVLD